MLKRSVDLRSDTVTLPTDEMRRAMYEAELGDDVYGEDPTVNHLEELSTEMLGKDAGLLVSSGTQGNLASILAHTTRGDALITGDSSHIFNYEAMSASTLGSVGILPVPTEDTGLLSPDVIAAAVPPDDSHKPRATLLCVENTHNSRGGRILSEVDMELMANTARSHRLKVHVDGARIFNASVGLNVPPAKLAEHADSLTFCLSKGLSCPVGSVIVGDGDFIAEARRWRKALGSGMRQAGIVAAAGIVALETMVDRLEEDHSNARRLAEGICEIPGISLNLDTVETNIIFFSVSDERGLELAAELQAEGVLVHPEKSKMRMVTHNGVNEEDIDYVLQSFRNCRTLTTQT